MSEPIDRSNKQWHIGRWLWASILALLAAPGVVALRHALETPQPLKSQLCGESLLYRWQRRSIFYKAFGAPDAPPLLLLHSVDIGASTHEMQHILAPLAETYRVYALDLLGFGLSDRPAIAYSSALYSALCRDFLLDVVQRPATVLASGVSCNYAVSVAADAPELCSSLVLLHPHKLGGERQPFLLRAYAEMPLVKMLLYPLLSTRPVFLLTHGRQRGKHTDFAQFYAQTHQLGAEHAVMALLSGKLVEDVTQQFADLKQPTLLVWGAQALESQRALASMRNAATLADPAQRIREVEIIQGTGKAVHEEQPASVVARMRGWQTETSPASRELVGALAQEQHTRTPGATYERSVQREKTLTDEPLPAPAPPEQETPATQIAAPVQLEQETPVAPAQLEQEASAPSEPEMLAAPIAASVQPEQAMSTAPIAASDEQQVEFEADDESSGKAIVAYCVKCKQKREMLNAHEVTMKNGRLAVRGTCPICGTNLNRIGGLP